MMEMPAQTKLSKTALILIVTRCIMEKKRSQVHPEYFDEVWHDTYRFLQNKSLKELHAMYIKFERIARRYGWAKDL